MSEINFKKSLFVLVSCIVIILNLLALTKEISKINKLKKITPQQQIGQRFYGLEKILKDERFVGYYTDKNIEEPQNNAQYSQAQYIIAPTVLQINNFDNKFTLFDCSTEEIAIKKLDQIGLMLIQKHNGLVLAKKGLQ